MQKESKIKKEKWGKPKLTVLTRGGRGEMVLSACKTATEYGGPNDFPDSQCRASEGLCPPICSSTSGT